MQTISAKRILISILAGVIIGKCLVLTTESSKIYQASYHTLDVGSQLFLRLLKMLVIPVVSISIICGISQLKDLSKLGSIGLKTFTLYVLTTAVAIAIAMSIAILLKVGSNLNIGDIKTITLAQAPSMKETIIKWIPSNPIAAMADNNMLQVIIFSLLIGVAIVKSSQKGKLIADFFVSLNEVMMSWVMLIMCTAPVGIFCLMAKLSMTTGHHVLKSLGLYALCIILALSIHVVVVYGSLLKHAKVSFISFMHKMYPAQLFAFSVASSSASIPIVLATVRDKLGISEKIANFVIPLGATINMDGTAIMQGVATIFIANAYNVDLSTIDLFTIMGMATMASVGTAGVPGVGLITLAMVLEQVGIPVEGIALIIGVDRILDMIRTAVNITGDATVATVIGKTEQLN